MEPKYIVEIKLIEQVTTVSNEWKKVRNVPNSIKEKPDFYDKDEIEEYGYVKLERTEQKETCIYSQVFNTNLDVGAVIKAANGD